METTCRINFLAPAQPVLTGPMAASENGGRAGALVVGPGKHFIGCDGVKTRR